MSTPKNSALRQRLPLLLELRADAAIAKSSGPDPGCSICATTPTWPPPARRKGYDLNLGMLHLDGQDYWGGDCINRLAMLRHRQRPVQRTPPCFATAPVDGAIPFHAHGPQPALTLLDEAEDT